MDAAAERHFRQFVETRSVALMRLAYLLTGGDQHAAEDVLQIALAKTAGCWSDIDSEEWAAEARGPADLADRTLRARPSRRSRRRFKFALTGGATALLAGVTAAVVAFGGLPPPSRRGGAHGRGRLLHRAHAHGQRPKCSRTHVAPVQPGNRRV